MKSLKSIFKIAGAVMAVIGTVLVPGSALSSGELVDGLLARGNEVHRVDVYTVEALSSTPSEVAAEYRQGLFDVVVVTSSSDWPIALTRTDETTVVAMSGMCTHQRCALVPQDGDLYCNCHGALFAVPDGAVIEGPAPEPLPPIEVTVEGTDVVMS